MILNKFIKTKDKTATKQQQAKSEREKRIRKKKSLIHS